MSLSVNLDWGMKFFGIRRGTSDLSFEAKRAMMRASTWKIIGTQRELQIIGNIHLAPNYVQYKTDDRYCGFAECGVK